MVEKSGAGHSQDLRANGLLVEVRCLDPAESDCGSKDKAQEAHAAKGRPEEVRVLDPTCSDNITIGQQNAHFIDAVAEASLGMMGFAVNVICNAARDDDDLRSRRNHREPAAWRKAVDDAS